ncbi:MAG: hypothetical protein GY702_01480 [Desulfobulbaceae bacterium]|nr:hypothetical protein [Desulfobulbaceae bacterium]
MSLSVHLDPDVENLALAIGLLRRTGGGSVVIDADFFGAPWNRVADIFSDEEQRAALISALEGLVPSAEQHLDEVTETVAGLGASLPLRTAYPLLDEGGKGQIYLVVARDGPAPGAPMQLSIVGEAEVSADGPGARAELVLLVASGNSIAAVAGSPDYPLSISATAPLAADGPRVTATAKVVAPPHAADSRFAIGLDTGDGNPLVLDLADAGPPIAELALLLLDLALAQASSLPAEVERLADALPDLLGLTDGMPPFPAGQLLSEPTAIRDWFNAVASHELDDGRRAIAVVLEALATLTDTKFETVPASAGTTDESWRIQLLVADNTQPGVAISIGVRNDGQGAVPYLVVGLQIGFAGDAAVDAELNADVTLVTIPLGGALPVRYLDHIELSLEATASGAPLIPVHGSGSSQFGVGGFRAGLRAETGADGPEIRPILELTDVTIGLGSSVSTIERVDLTSEGSVSDATETVVDDALSAGLGAAGDRAVDALRALLGLGTQPGLDMADFVSGPVEAIAAYYRALLADPDGWKPIVTALAQLLDTAPPDVTGDGSAEDPWRVELAALTPPQPSPLAVQLAVWHETDDGASTFVLGLRAVVETGACDAVLTTEVLRVDLSPTGGTAARFLSRIGLNAAIRLDMLQPAVGGVRVSAGEITATAAWTPGQPIEADLELQDLTVIVDGDDLVLSPFAPLRVTGIDPTADDLGLGLDSDALWPALRALLARGAHDWLGRDGGVLASLFGITNPISPDPAHRLPPLNPLPGTHVGDLLTDPGAALRGWLQTVIDEPAADVAAAGGSALDALVRLAQALLEGDLTDISSRPVLGGGTRNDPWRFPLLAKDAPVALTVWLDDDGPPAALAETPLDQLSGPRVTPAELIDGADRLRGHASWISAALHRRDLSQAASALERVVELLDYSDGVLAAVSAIPVDANWLIESFGSSGHGDACADPTIVEGVGARIDALTSGLASDEWTVLLMAPPLAGTDPWSAIVDEVGAGPAEAVSMRQPGISPWLVDPGIVASSTVYEVDLANDGDRSVDEGKATIERVVATLAPARPDTKFVLVAHSYLGLAAEAFVAEHPPDCVGLITVAAPLGAGPDADLLDPTVADAIRLAQELAPVALAASDNPTGRALASLSRLLDGYPLGSEGALVPGLLGGPAWQREGPMPSLSGVSATAFITTLPGSLDETLATALADDVRARVRTTSDRLCWGAQCVLDLPEASTGTVHAEALVNLELGDLMLTSDGTTSSGTGQLDVRIDLWRDDGAWLVESPVLDGRAPGRARTASFTGSLAPSGSGMETTFDVVLTGASLRGADATVAVGLDDPRTSELLDLLAVALDGPGPLAPQVEDVLDLLSELGFVRRRTSDEPAAFLADAFVQARADGNGWFAARLPALLDRPGGILGLERDALVPVGGGPWRLVYDSLPFEIRVEKEPWRVSVGPSSAGLLLAQTASIGGFASVAISDGALDRDLICTVAGMEVTWTSHELVLSGGWLTEPLHLLPADPSHVQHVLANSLPRFLGDVVLRALAEQVLGEEVPIPIWPAFEEPGTWLFERFGAAPGAGLDSTVITRALEILAGVLGMQTNETHPFVVPDALSLSAESHHPADDAITVTAETVDPITLRTDHGADATLDLGLSARIGADRTAIPGGRIAVHVPLPSGSVFGSVTIELGLDATGLTLTAQTDSGVDITLLPELSGFNTLASAAIVALLPVVLDRVEEDLGTGPALSPALDVADALDLRDPASPLGQRFQARSQQLADLQTALADGDLTPLATASAAALRDLLDAVTGASPHISRQGSQVRVEVPVAAGAAVVFSLDLSTSPPSLSVALDDLDLAPLSLGVSAGISGGELMLGSEIALVAAVLDGVSLRPSLTIASTIAFTGSATPTIELIFFPLGSQHFGLPLAPPGPPLTAAQVTEIATDLVIPLAGNLLLTAADDLLDTPMWSSGKTVGELVEATGFVERVSNQYRFVAAIPEPLDVVRGALDLLSTATVGLPGGVELSILSDGGQFGVNVAGELKFSLGGYALSVHLSLPDEHDLGWDARGEGSGLILLDLSDTTDPKLSPVVRLGGFGAGLTKAGDAPLIDLGGFQLGGAAGYLSVDVALAGPNGVSKQGDVFGAVAIDGLSLAITLPGDGGNAVAASLVKSDGGGDAAPGVPGFDMLIGNSPTGMAVSFAGEPELTLEINRTFGPLHVDSMALAYVPIANSHGELGLALDASIAIAGISVAADDLTVFVPLDDPTDIDGWRIDLSGLAISYDTSAVRVAGGLLKATLPSGDIEYRGALSVQLGSYGLSAIGAYARVQDGEGEYTSLFAFLALSAPLGGPPFLFVTGIAGGVGYNRRLLTPRDPASVPSFPLVTAMDGLSGDPMEQLERMGTDIPPARGALWLAAGVRFSTFELLKTTALVTVATDRGFEVSLLGLMRFSLPTTESAQIVSLELALSAKYSTVDQVLSIQAQLTDNSWLLSRDCRLTGGFAFIIWMKRPEVLLSVGGYSSKFTPPDHYPVVPRVGFDWSVGSGISVKGGAFFAVTHSAVMVGGSLEASYRVGPVRAWFTAELDVIITWDPFSYDATASVEVGVEVKLQACLFGKCVSLPPFRATISATLHLHGPPLSGLVEVNVAVASIRVPFGNNQPQSFLSWPEVRDKYVGQGSQSSISAGGLAADEAPDGTETKPWPVATEFSMRVESKMPATGLKINGLGQSISGVPSGVDLVPCGPAHGRISPTLEVTIERRSGAGTWLELSASEIAHLDQTHTNDSFPAAVWDGAATSIDSKGNQVVDTDHPMLIALSTVELTSAPAIVEATGAIPELPFSSMVDEQPSRSMSFGRAAGAADRGGQRGALAPDASVHPVERLARVDAVAITAAAISIEPERLANVTAKRAAPSVASASTAAASRVAVWKVSTQHPHSLQLSDAKQRVVALSATGAVLEDREVDAVTADVAEGAQSVIVANPIEGALMGWELATELVQAGPGTFLTPGAVITTERPWQPRKSARLGGVSRPAFPANKLVRAFDSLTTQITWAEATKPETLLIRLDGLSDDASLDDLDVEIAGAEKGRRRSVRKGDRTEVMYPITLSGTGGTISVAISGAQNWTIAGVIAVDEDATTTRARVNTDDFVRLAPAIAGLGPDAATAVSVIAREEER